MRQAITVTRHKNLCISSSYTQKQRRGELSLNLQRILTSPTLRFATHYSGQLSGFFIIKNTLTSSVPSLDQGSTAKAILSCATHSNTTGWQQGRGTPFTAALFSLTPSAKSHSEQAGHQEHGQLPVTQKSLGYGVFRR